ncbi:hypothetical protein B0H63DRAFT_394959 [Podospora didyma]|uniref:Uncharacterized protein n=1 Tax=Podospora didyma TaxID=330526 RepID=A0AAE0NPE1_9PEZI|nr:hypothetical protein B0H63DRAFT_394959 [Podospora didyma]
MFKSLIYLAGLVAVATALPARPSCPPPQHPIKYPYANTTLVTRQVTWTCRETSDYTAGDAEHEHGKGIFITNGDKVARGFYAYQNSCEYMPYKHIWIDAGETRFISFPDRWEGRIVRGDDETNLAGEPQTLATWVEFSLDAQGWIWGDVSLIRGCDGAVRLWATDGSKVERGFAKNILVGAPRSAYARKPNGACVLKHTENSDGSINTAVRDWELKHVGAAHAYVDDAHGNPVIASTNGRFGAHFYPGRP